MTISISTLHTNFINSVFHAKCIFQVYIYTDFALRGDKGRIGIGSEKIMKSKISVVKKHFHIFLSNVPQSFLTIEKTKNEITHTQESVFHGLLEHHT